MGVDFLSLVGLSVVVCVSIVFVTPRAVGKEGFEFPPLSGSYGLMYVGFHSFCSTQIGRAVGGEISTPLGPLIISVGVSIVFVTPRKVEQEGVEFPPLSGPRISVGVSIVFVAPRTVEQEGVEFPPLSVS